MDFFEDLAGFVLENPVGLIERLAWTAVAALVVIVVHEIGHAVAARALLGGEARVTVGSSLKLADIRIGQMTLAVNALSDPRRAAGYAEFDVSRATARDVLLIALAGPAASLACFALAALAHSAAPDGTLREQLAAATFVSAVSLANLVPLKLQERRGGPVMRTDGRLALDALRAMRALR